MSSRVSLAAVCAVLLAGCAYASQCWVNFPQDAYPSCVQLSPNVSMHWTAQAGYITWALDVDGAWDWVGVGIAEAGMLGADLAVAEHDTDEAQWTASDYWSTDFAFPQRDKQQDVKLVSVARHASGSSAGGGSGSTLVALQRPLESCDPNGQDRPVLNDTRQTVVFAYGIGEFGYHGTTNRGQYDVALLPNATAAEAAAAATAAAAQSMQVLEIRMPNFTVPTLPTTYQCVNVELPSDAKYHIYRYEPVVDKATVVHHFVAYTCAGNGAPMTAVGVPYDCLEYMECEEFYMGWAPGLGPIDAPPAAALAFGMGSVRYIALQIHYTNLDGVPNQVDSSGFRLHYSPILKQYDMGVLTIGSYGIAVPPGAPSWTTEPNICPGACTAKLVAGSGAPSITLVESMYHMHQAGKAMITRHVRNGNELAPLGFRDYFQFDYQAAVDIPPGTRRLLPGDMLITTCTYTGVGRTNVTMFGLASYEEMCFNFLTYYPYNPNITHCVAMAELNMATCATTALTDSLNTTDDIQRAATAGQLVPLPPDDGAYKPYQPICKRSVAYQADDDDETTSHHQRSVGGAVAAILIITVVGSVAVVVVYRIMRKKRQAEEEQHLFEKYNPSTIALPVVGGGATQTDGVAGGSSSAGYHSLSSATV